MKKENLVVWVVFKKVTDEKGYSYFEMEDIYKSPQYIPNNQGHLYKVTLKNYSEEMGFETFASFQNLKKNVEHEIDNYIIAQIYDMTVSTVEKYFWKYKKTLTTAPHML